MSLLLAPAQATAAVPEHHQRVATAKAAAIQCFADADDPDVLTSTSRSIHAVGRVTGCTSRPDSCRLRVDLEQYNGALGYWTTVAHKDSGWKAGCRRAWWGGYPFVDTVYHCTHDNDTRWGYRTVIYFDIEDDGDIASDRAQSINNKLFRCF
ncbi:hypothetical protein [Amycolatopsis sp. NPDC051128]|uniref:hypothetical protein n=1 Tax=Amycolatopsis sp. NPDC051128 TaxID=3155412 RepID=UPI0034300BC5